MKLQKTINTMIALHLTFQKLWIKENNLQLSKRVTKTLFHVLVHICETRFSLHTSIKSNIFQQTEGRGRYKNPVAFIKPVTKEICKHVK